MLFPPTLVPKHPATIVPKESTRKDLFISFASLFSSVNPAFIERPVTVPILLKIDMKMKTNTHTHTAMSVVKISSVPTNLKAVGIKEGGKLTIFSGKDGISKCVKTFYSTTFSNF